MQPTITKPKLPTTRTSVGNETVNQTVARAQNMLKPSTGFTVPMPDTVPAEALNGNVGRTDVRSMRDKLEQSNLATEQFNTDYGNLMGRVQAPLQSTPFSNPQDFIEQTLLRRTTDTQNTLDQTRQGQADTLRGMGNELDTTRQNAVEQFALPELQQNLADTRNRIAERTNQLRTTLRDFETNAERRGVARQFVDSEKGKVQADAAAELADLAIIESAQAGNVKMAQEDIERAVNAKLQSFEFENQAIQTEIKRLEAMDTRESQARSEQLKIALDERTRNIEQAVADEKQKLTYLSEAAANGADQGTLDAIRKSTSVGEAAMMAGPFIGRLDRMAKEANIAQSWASAASSNTNRLLALAGAGDPDAIAKLKFDPRTVEEEVDPVTRRQLEGGLESSTNLLRLANKYKTIIDNYGYTNKAFGDTQLLGEIESLRALMTAEYKKAETLGTLDAGVLALMSQIVGEEPTSGLFTPLTNATGRKSDKLSAQLGTFIENMTIGQASTKARLGIEPTVDFSVITPEDDAEINAAFGVNTSTQAQGGFNPQTYFK
jgi:hypothetical protein